MHVVLAFRITTAIHVQTTIKQIMTVLMSPSQLHRAKAFAETCMA